MKQITHTIIIFTMKSFMYGGESNENLKSVIKIQNTDRLSCKLTTMILVVWRVADGWQ